MFETDLNRLAVISLRENFVAKCYENAKVSDVCAELMLNPAVVAMAREKYPEFDQAIRKAQSWRSDAMVDTLENIHNEIRDPKMAAVVSQNRQWVAGKRKRDIYGDKLDVAITHTIDIRTALLDARQRLTPLIPLEDIDNDTDNISVARLSVDELLG